MNKILISQQGGALTVNTQKIIASKAINRPKILTEKEWGIENKSKFPPSFSDDYYYLMQIHYQAYLKSIQCDIESYHREILISDPKSTSDAVINSILVSLKATYFSGAIDLVLREKNGTEVSLYSLRDLQYECIENRRFEEFKVDLIKLIHPVLPDFSLTKGQSLYLFISGGIVLTDNIMISSTYN
jgi:hypothetical protein